MMVRRDNFKVYKKFSIVFNTLKLVDAIICVGAKHKAFVPRKIMNYCVESQTVAKQAL
jgi:hypothetical protein